jgi:hypothetical protein
LRNEVVEESGSDLMSESGAKRDVPLMRAGRSSGMESKKGRRREALRASQEKRPEGSARRRKLVRDGKCPGGK